MSSLTSALHLRTLTRPSGPLTVRVLVGFALAVVVLLALRTSVGSLVLLLPVAAAAALVGLWSPIVASGYLLVFTFFRLAIPSGTFPVDPFLPAFVGVVISVWVWPGPRGLRLPAIDALGGTMLLYVLWILGSVVSPHAYPAGSPGDPESFPMARFIIIGTIMPFTMHLVGRTVFTSERAIRALLAMLLGFSTYSAIVSIAQFHGPRVLVWPSYIVDDPNWDFRAVGVFNQPVVNGLVLVIGFFAAVMCVVHDQRRSVRIGTGIVAALTAYGIYLTHTRAVWISFALIVLLGIVVAGRHRAAFMVTGAAMTVGVVLGRGTLLSEDRSRGGVGSVSEVHDRLNAIATSLWAVREEPFTGWGIGRFPAVNTYHHAQWSPTVPWERGYGVSSHFDILGVLVELGIVGLALWVGLLTLILVGVFSATRRLPAQGLCNRPFALIALAAWVALLVTGLTVDLRFFDFPNIVVMMLAGAAIGRTRLLQSGSYPLAPADSSVGGPPTSVPAVRC